MAGSGTEEFRRAAEALRGADKTVLSEVGKGMRTVSRPVVAEIRGKVRSSKGRSPGRGGSSSAVERQLHALARSGGRPLKPLTERQVRSLNKKLARITSLRENIASATGAAVSTQPERISLAFKVRASQLPPSQRKLPRRWDAENGWKHPVFGNRNVWVRQYGSPYFRKTIFARKGELERGATGAMSKAAEKIVHPETGGA